MFTSSGAPAPEGSVVVAAIDPDGVDRREVPPVSADPSPSTVVLAPSASVPDPVAAAPEPGPAPVEADPEPTTTETTEVPAPPTTTEAPAPTTTTVPAPTTTTSAPPPPPEPEPEPEPEPAPPAEREPEPEPAALSAEHADGTHEGMVSWYDLPGARPGVCAHRTIEKGTVVTVTNLDTGESITCTVNDRGPYSGDDKVLDLHLEDFSRLAPPEQGVFPARLDW